jgi:RNA polymerase sigma-70 factor, ECF subfamily
MPEFEASNVGWAAANNGLFSPCVATESIESIYRRYGGLVYRICLRMLRDPIEAEDAAQDVFVHVLRKIHTFRGESAFSSWLYRLTTNLVLMRFRKNKRDASYLTDSQGDNRVDQAMAAPDLRLGAVLCQIDLEAALDRLPDGYKASFVLHDVQGYDHKEIARIFGYSVGNSKSQLHKARKRLRMLLAGMPGKKNGRSEFRQSWIG